MLGKPWMKIQHGVPASLWQDMATGFPGSLLLTHPCLSQKGATTTHNHSLPGWGRGSCR